MHPPARNRTQAGRLVTTSPFGIISTALTIMLFISVMGTTLVLSLCIVICVSCEGDVAALFHSRLVSPSRETLCEGMSQVLD